jgi:hypothetical protein
MEPVYCSICGRLLHTHKTRAAGMGPVCARKRRWVVDDFLIVPHTVRRMALDATYQDVVVGGATYPHIAPTDLNPYERFAEIMDMPNEGKGMEFFRYYLEDDTLPSYIHHDASLSKWSAILYLNEPKQCAGGTAFWQPKERLNESELWKKGHDSSAWLQTDVVRMKFNRLLIFESSRWHSLC